MIFTCIATNICKILHSVPSIVFPSDYHNSPGKKAGLMTYLMDKETEVQLGDLISPI